MGALTAKKAPALNVTLRRRLGTTVGAILIGVAAIGFAGASDLAQKTFIGLARHWPWAPIVVTPLGFVLLAWLTRRYAPEVKGSGIPQVIAAAKSPHSSWSAKLISLPGAGWKMVLTIAALAIGGSVGREGPTVQISAAILVAFQRLVGARLSSAMIIAGGAAGVSAAFNTPLAGVAFAIEELASAYEQRMALIVMAAVMISGFTSQSLAGDYIYFGAMHRHLSLITLLMVVPAAGVIGGASGALFSRAMLAVSRSNGAPFGLIRRHPLAFAFLCGAIVAVAGFLTEGATFGTGYDVAKRLVESHQEALWFGPAKFVTSLATAVSGIAGGIFAPSLAVGAGVGNLISLGFTGEPSGPVVVLGMIAYFVGVVRAPLTGVIIVSEMTDRRAMLLPLFACAILADGVSALVCRERLYHGLAKGFRPSAEPADPA